MIAPRTRPKPPDRKHLAGPRRELDPHSTEFNVRFALHLRELIGKKKWSVGDLHRALEDAEVQVTMPAVKKWLKGDAIPTMPMLENIASVLGVADYRKILPPPLN